MELEYSLRGLLSAFFRQKIKFMLVFLAVVAVGGAYLVSLTPIFEASGSMLVKFGQDARLSVDVSRSGGATEVSSSDRQEIIQSNITIIYSQDLLRSAVTEFGPGKLYPSLLTAGALPDTPVSLAVRNLQRGDLKALAGTRNNVIELTVVNKNPEVAAAFAALLMERFIARQADIYNKPETGFLAQQVAEASDKLDAAQKEMQSFRQIAGISDMDAEIEQLMRQKTDLSSIAFQAVSNAQANLADLEAKQAEMLATYRSNTPAMERVRQSIAAARDELIARQTDLNPAMGENSSTLAESLAVVDQRLSYLETQRSAYEDMQQRVTVAQENLKFYQQHGEEARANDILNQQNITRISVIDTPVVPAQPIGRNRKLLLLAFLMTGGLLGLITALAFEMGDDRFRTPYQLTLKTGLPVLASFNAKEGV